MNGSYFNSLIGEFNTSAKVERISIVSPHNYNLAIETFKINDQNDIDRLRSQLQVEKTAVENSVVIESFVYQAANGQDQSRVVRLSIECYHIKIKRSPIDWILRKPNRFDVFVGSARFNMPIGQSYLGYGFNTGVLMVYFPIDRIKSLKDNFLQFMKSERF